MKIKPTYETEVFINRPGYLTIKQADNLGNEDQIVMLSPEQARMVMEEVERLLVDADLWWTAEVEEDEQAA